MSSANSDFLSINSGNIAGTVGATSSSGFAATGGNQNFGPFTTVPSRTSVANIPAVVFDYRVYSTAQRLGTLGNNALFNGMYASSNW